MHKTLKTKGFIKENMFIPTNSNGLKGPIAKKISLIGVNLLKDNKLHEERVKFHTKISQLKKKGLSCNDRNFQLEKNGQFLDKGVIYANEGYLNDKDNYDKIKNKEREIKNENAKCNKKQNEFNDRNCVNKNEGNGYNEIGDIKIKKRPKLFPFALKKRNIEKDEISKEKLKVEKNKEQNNLLTDFLLFSYDNNNKKYLKTQDNSTNIRQNNHLNLLTSNDYISNQINNKDNVKCSNEEETQSGLVLISNKTITPNHKRTKHIIQFNKNNLQKRNINRNEINKLSKKNTENRERIQEIIKKNIELFLINKNNFLVPTEQTVPYNSIVNSIANKKDEDSLLGTPVENKINYFNKFDKKKANKYLKDNKNSFFDTSNLEENEVFNDNEIKHKNKKIPLFNCKHMSQIFSNFKILINYINTIIQFFDEKGLCNLALVNRELYKISRKILYNKIKEELLNKNNIELQTEIHKSLFKYSKFPIDSQNNQFDDYLNKECNQKSQIQNDLTRTIIDDPSFKKGEHNYKSLNKILRAYANFNQKIGYTQGINFLVAYSLYLFKDDEKSVFCFVDGIIRRLNMEQYYSKTNTLYKKLRDLGNFLRRFVPDIFAFLEKNYLNHEFFTTNWVLTLYSNSICKSHLFIVWDYMFIFGWKFFNYFAVAVLLKYKVKIINSNPKKLPLTMKDLLKTNTFKSDFNNIIDEAFILMNNNII